MFHRFKLLTMTNIFTHPLDEWTVVMLVVLVMLREHEKVQTRNSTPTQIRRLEINHLSRIRMDKLSSVI